MALYSRLLRVLLVLGVGVVSPAGTATISTAAARRLVREALAVMKQDGPSVRIDATRRDCAPGFYTFQAWWPNPDGSPIFTVYFAVNPRTGDVWDVMGCERITSAALEKEQESIFRRSGLTPTAAKAFRAKSPLCCPVDPEAGSGPK